VRLAAHAFADMTGRIDPPSSLGQMTAESLAQKAHEETLFLAWRGAYPVGCLFARLDGAEVYLGKIAVRPGLHGNGIGSGLIKAAETWAQAQGADHATLQSRVELTENHRLFARLNYREVARTCHDGYAAPTSITFAKTLT
jgi:GNAT superfamily N-acetyltransferase